jgi:ubiquinone/menaquinone biosynthesis C-methylase UbiE
VNRPAGATDSGSDVRQLFDDKAAGWRSKYRRAAPLVWRLDAFSRALGERLPPPAAVLDFGCGTGDLAAHLARDGYQLTAGDISRAMLAEAERAFGERGIRWAPLEAASPALPFADAAFDAVVASSVLEYVPAIDATLAELARVVRAGGFVLATVPNPRHPTRRLEQVLAKLVELPPGRALLALSRRLRAYGQYLRLSRNRASSEEWAGRARRHGFEQLAAASTGPGGTMWMLVFRRAALPR